MTASSIELFPCRVQLMGLPRSSNPITANTSRQLGNLGTPLRPPISKVKAVSRNLFGAPDPVEMENFYHQESQRLRSYVLQRYNFDTKNSKAINEQEQQQPTDKCTRQTANNHAVQPTQFPTLIENELREHEQRLHAEECNLKRSSLGQTSSNDTNSNHIKNISHNTRRCEISSCSLPALERQKPYTRQSLLTERFNVRKNKACVSKAGDYCNAKIASLGKCESPHRNFEVLQLPQTICSDEKKCDIKDNEFKSPTNNGDCKQEDYSESNTNGSTINNCNDNCAKVSLKLVVSTKNVS